MVSREGASGAFGTGGSVADRGSNDLVGCSEDAFDVKGRVELMSPMPSKPVDVLSRVCPRSLRLTLGFRTVALSGAVDGRRSLVGGTAGP